MKISFITALLNGIVKAIKALNCKCKSSCCQSECIQRKNSDPSPQDIKEFTVIGGKIKHITEL